MTQQTLLGQIHSDHQRFESLSQAERHYTKLEVKSVGGVSPGSSLASKSAPGTRR